MIETDPEVTAVTSPVLETEALAPLPELQIITRPVSKLLFASRVTADNCTVPPICRVAVAGETDTDATGIGGGAVTLSADDAVLPSLDALIIAVPAPTALTDPVTATVATLVFELAHTTARPESGAPVESTSVAVVQDLDDLGSLVGCPEVSFVHNKGSADLVDEAKDW